MEDKLYVAKLADQRLKPLSIEEVVVLIEMGVIHGHEFLFSIEDNDWIKPCDCVHFQSYGPFEPPEIEFEKPDFIPPIFFPSAEITITEKEYKELNDRLDNQESIISALQTEISSLQIDRESWSEKENEWIDSVDELRHSKASLENELEELKAKASYWEGQFEAYSQKESSDEDKSDSLKVFNLEEELSHLKNLYDDAIEENKKLADIVKSLGQKSKEKSLKIKKISSVYKTQKEKFSTLEKDLTKFKKKDIEQTQIINTLEKFKDNFEQKEQAELDRLIGDYYEVDNGFIWNIQIDNEIKGPYRYEDMKSFIKFKKLPESTMVRKKGEKDWCPLHLNYELKANIVEKIDRSSGKEVKRFFFPRSDYRAPFYELATLEIGGQEFKGHCTSLSVGGCFMEFSKLDLDAMKKGSVGVIKISSETLSEEITAGIIVRNISERRPKGLGMQFQAVASKEKEAILEYINNYLDSQKEAA